MITNKHDYNDFLTQWDLHRQCKREEPLQPGLQSPKYEIEEEEKMKKFSVT